MPIIVTAAAGLTDMRTSRLFDVTQVLRSRRSTVTLTALAVELGVLNRAAHHHLNALLPLVAAIEGTADVGYLFKWGYLLLPLMLTIDELEVLTSGALLECQRSDAELGAGASKALAISRRSFRIPSHPPSICRPH